MVFKKPKKTSDYLEWLACSSSSPDGDPGLRRMTVFVDIGPNMAPPSGDSSVITKYLLATWLVFTAAVIRMIANVCKTQTLI